MMSNKIQKLQPGDRIELSLSGECYQVLKNDGIFIKTRNINNGYGRTFTLRYLSNQKTVIKYSNFQKITESPDRSRQEALYYLGTFYSKANAIETKLN